MGFYGQNNMNSTNFFTSDTTFSNDILIVDAYSKIPKIHVMEKLPTEEVMDNLYMSQSRFGKNTKFGWWDLERILAYTESQFTSTEFKEECQICGVYLTLAAPEHQEMNGQVKVIRRTLCTIAH